MSDIATTQGSEPPLDWPYYGIGFGAAIKRFFAKYATFTGRASRGEYWWAYLFYVVIVLVLYGIFIAGIIAASTAASSGGDLQFGAGFYAGSSLLSLFVLGTIVPYLAVTVRRLHDAGHSGWFILIGLIPAVGGIILIVLLASATNPVVAEMYGPPRSQGGYGGGYGQLPQQPYGQPQQAYDPGQAYDPRQQYGQQDGQQQPYDGGQQYGQQQPYDPPRG
jgi:uncharacterized membrane protein YhaH (DUF805 family)